MKKILVLIFSAGLILLYSTDIKVIMDSIKDKNPVEQIIILERYLKEEKNNLNLYILKAQIEINIRDFLGAEETLLMAYNINQKNTKVLNLLGITYFLLKDYKKSSYFFNLVLKIEKNNETALNYLSILDPFDKTLKEEKYQNIGLSKEDLVQLIKEFEDLDIDKKEDMVYLLYEKELEVIDEDRMNYTIHCVVKILNSAAVSYFRDFEMSYNAFEFLPEVIYAGTYDYELNFKSVNHKNIVILDKKNQDSMYTNKKHIAFPFPDVNKGSIVEYKIKFHTTNKKLTPKIFDSYLFSSSIRILNSNYIIKYPSNLHLNILNTSNNVKIDNDVIIENDKNINFVKYSYKNPPIIKNEEDSDINIYDISEKVIIGTFYTWDEISKWYSNIFEKTLFQGDASKEIFRLIKLENLSKLEQIELIYKFIQKNIKYVGIELEENAFVPHNSEEIFKNRFGDCKDQALLTIHLLRKIGIKAYPVLVSTKDNGTVIKDIPSPFYFNHLITYIPVQDGITEDIYLDTTSSFTEFLNLPSVDQGIEVLIVKSDGTYEFRSTPVISYTKNRIEEIYIAKANIIGSGELKYIERFTGAYSEMIRNSTEDKDKEDVIDKFYEVQQKSFNNLKKENFEISGIDEISGEIEIKLTTYYKNITNIFYDGRQKIKYSSGNLNSFYNIPEKSEYDYTKNFLSSYKKVIEYIFPDNYKITEGNFKNLKKENKYISVEFYADKKSDNHIILTFESFLKERVIKKEDLKGLNDFLRSVQNELTFEITFENKINFDFEEFYKELVKEYNQKDVYENYVKKMLELKKSDKAFEVAKNAMNLFPDYYFFYAISASILVDKRMFNEAENILLNGLEKTNYDINIYAYLIELYKKSNENKKLENILLETLKKFPSNSNIVFEITSFYNRLGEYDKAINILEEVIKKNPLESGYFAELGYVYSLKQDFKNAGLNFKKALELNPNNANAMNNLAWLYCENNVNIKEAIELAKKACEIEQYNDSYWDTLAEAYFLNKEYEKAIEAINRAIKINPNYTYLQQQLEKIKRVKEKMENK